jgi:hypothetical protein
MQYGHSVTRVNLLAVESHFPGTFLRRLNRNDIIWVHWADMLIYILKTFFSIYS